jgi:GH15 family glucan-1,4-alpha-glucosidase
MARIEDYALLGDLQTAALVERGGSIDWLCFPRFDSGACFAALLGTPENGRWLLAPQRGGTPTRRYLHDTLVLETTWKTDEGTVRVLDFMPPRGRAPDVVRIVEGIRGSVRMHSELIVRFDYGHIVPWVVRVDGDSRKAVAGPNGLCFRTPARTRGENMRTLSEFRVDEGERVPFVLTWYPSHEDVPHAIDPEVALAETESFWREWHAVRDVEFPEDWRPVVNRSLTVLKALTYAPTGGIVAAPTTSLPERVGGVRNWDYRYCWLRDATLTLLALLGAGHADEAKEWRNWLLRAVAGDPADLQIMYGVAGERRLTELELPWLPGYEESAPVRIGNAASEQLQIDVYGEVMDALYQARVHGLEDERHAWSLQQVLLDYLEGAWARPDEGIWEIRGRPRHFVHSKVMAWVAFDRGVRMVETQGLEGPVDRWRAVRDEIHREVLERGYDEEFGSFTQSYGSKEIDASLLMIPLVGFLPASDPRVRGTVDAVQRDLMRDGFVIRYRTKKDVDGLPAGEGVFLPCSFWLVDCLELLGRHDEAQELFERLLAVANDIGLLAEEYDPAAERLLGNFPQAFTHLALVNSAFNVLPHLESPMHRRHAE